MDPKNIRYIISSVAIVLLIIHLIWPNLRIDAISLTLIAIAVIPWLAPLFKSIELPGGMKVEFQELKSVTDRAEKAGLVAPEPATPPEMEFAFQLVANTDHNLAMAGLRIEIERRLVQLAESRGIRSERRGIGILLRDLNVRQLINGAERAALSDLSGLLNSAVHGATVEKAALDWALEIGPRILRALDDRIRSEVVSYEGIT